MKPLYITRHVPEKSVILLVDPDYEYVEETLECLEDEHARIVKRNVDVHIANIVHYVTKLKEDGHIIASTHAKKYWDGLLPLIDVHLPEWSVYEKGGNLSLHQDIVSFAEGKEVVVGGLWLELCVFEVASRLQNHYEDKVKLFDGDFLSISYTETYMVPDDDVLTLMGACEAEDLFMKLCG